MRDEFRKTVPFELLTNLLEDKIVRLLLDIVGNKSAGID